MGKQENMVLSVETAKEVFKFRDLFTEQEQTLLMIFSNSTNSYIKD